MPLASQVEAGNVSIIRAEWSRALLDEMRDFPWGKKDDQVDALVRAFTTLTTRPRSTRFDSRYRYLAADQPPKVKFGIPCLTHSAIWSRATMTTLSVFAS